MRRRPISLPVFAVLAALAVAAQARPATAADPVFPINLKLGLVPPPGLNPVPNFGFEDREHNVFIRMFAWPEQAYAEIERTMTADALKKQGMTVEKRETLALPSGNAILTIVRQETDARSGLGRIRKWLLIAPINKITALISFEMPAKSPTPYSDEVVRATLTSLVSRPSVPDVEQLAVVPFKVGDTAGLRLVRVVAGVAAQFTDGPKDTFDAIDQPHLIIAAAPGGPQQTSDRDQFARNAMRDLPPLKDVRISTAEPMRIGGQPGYEVRATGKDAQSGIDIEIVQWLRFGTGAYLRILGFGPKDKWPETFTRFREVRDGLEPR